MVHFKAWLSTSVKLAQAKAESWYRNIFPGLVTQLNAEIATLIEDVLKHPFNNGDRFEQVRSVNFKILPYGYFYTVDDETGIVSFIRFFHIKMNLPYSNNEERDLIANEP